MGKRRRGVLVIYRRVKDLSLEEYSGRDPPDFIFSLIDPPAPTPFLYHTRKLKAFLFKCFNNELFSLFNKLCELFFASHIFFINIIT